MMRTMRQWNEDLHKTLKGKVEHRLFLMWTMAEDDDTADQLMQRLIDVRFERKKCEAIVKQARFDYEHLQSLNLI
jgi:hypothetical protein